MQFSDPSVSYQFGSDPELWRGALLCSHLKDHTLLPDQVTQETAFCHRE
jgi:hypothetical protein